MKAVAAFWRKRSSYEKAVIGLFAAFVISCLGYFSGRLYYGSRCCVCRLRLVQGEDYVLDVRTGEVQALSAGRIRFPYQAARTARYCSGHTAGLDSDLLVLSPVRGATLCYALREGRNFAPDGRTIVQRLDEGLGCWEIEVWPWDPADGHATAPAGLLRPAGPGRRPG